MRLICVLGDNLGRHWLGGFCTNLSTVTNSFFFCWYCLVRKEKDDAHSKCHMDEIRTLTITMLVLLQLILVHHAKVQAAEVCGPGIPNC